MPVLERESMSTTQDIELWMKQASEITRQENEKENNRGGKMTKHELIKLLDNTFYDVEFDVFDDTEGLVRVNFVIDKEEKDA
jgi:hypothetical protein